MDDFLWRALLAGIGVALMAGPLGCFVVWRRMAYFGDTLAHAALLGVAIGYLLDIDLVLGVVGTSLALALLLVAIERRRLVPTDTLLGILAHSGLAIGLVVIAFVETLRVDLMAYLFGDLLAVSHADLWWIGGAAAVALPTLAWAWRSLVAVTVSEDLASVEGVPVTLARILFPALLALVVAVAMKAVGVLLVTALLILPAAAARRLARTPEAMALLAALIGAVAVTGGLGLSLRWDTPAGPSAVVVALAIFLFMIGWPRRPAPRDRQAGQNRGP
ncbi:zinc transport system permease protein [Stella humosa]|uniref:High-affinity zinc uptake system membrane protein ZnuB n=1 Tax=Stella humosa TaxID=94 RepID=A0A3N1KWL0_9PROT|nr:zinc ABC transporter permease subunit ZnuB [Stella humosa]ROP83637.1 zinc transport system permease protein [Stella humosa]BBK33090.1 zinc ABC transporter permease [Stella humosa]